MEKGPVAIAPGHVAADAATDQGSPEKRYCQRGEQMDEGCQAHVQIGDKAIAPVRPVFIMKPFQQQQHDSRSDQKVVPLRETLPGGIQDKTAKHHSGSAYMGGAYEDVQPALDIWEGFGRS